MRPFIKPPISALTPESSAVSVAAVAGSEKKTPSAGSWNAMDKAAAIDRPPTIMPEDKDVIFYLSF